MTQEKAIQEAKDAMAKNRGFKDYADFIKDNDDSEWQKVVDEIMIEYASSSSEKGDATEMALCEIDHLILHEDQLYSFKKHEGCKGCEEYNGVTHQSSKQFSEADVTAIKVENLKKFLINKAIEWHENEISKLKEGK